MKNLKYLKLFESFKSKKLNKTLGYIKSYENRNLFLSDLLRILKSIDFPESEISDDYIEYLPFHKALKKVDILEDEPCDATSASVFPEFAVEGAKCEGGKIARKWGKRIRKVKCPICEGTGVKPKEPGNIKMAKFWFSNDGKYLAKTAVDGIIRNIGNEDKKMSNDLSDYRVGKRVSKDNLLNLENGTFALINILGRETICYIYKSNNSTYALQYYHNGDGPSYSYNDWKKIAPYVWALGGSDHKGGKLLYPKENDKYPDPYTWNVPLIIGYPYKLKVGHERLNNSLNGAHFALVLDFSKLKNSSFEYKSNIKSKRIELKSGAFLTDEEIRSQNIKRYIDQISKSMDIISDISNVNKLLKRILSYKFALFIIAGRGHQNTLELLIDHYYALFREENESEKQYYIRKIESVVKDSVTALKNNNLPNNLEIIKNKLVENDKQEHLKLFNELIKLSDEIYNKIKSYNIETIEDLEVVYQKLLSISNLFNTFRYAVHSLRHFFEYLQHRPNRAYEKLVDSYYGVSEEKAKVIISELERIRKIILKL